MLPFLFLASCNGCRPEIPPFVEPDTQQDSDTDSTETGDSTPVDTAPVLPPRCDFMEVEPNDQAAQAMAIAMEQWACGVMMPADPKHAPFGDVDYFGFTAPEAGWVEVDVEAAARGSAADMQFIVYDDDDSITVTDRYLSTDPLLRFPGAESMDYTVILGETSLLFGEDYAWYLLTSMVKAPVEWTFNETEPNDQYTAANPFTLGTTVYGTVGDAGDFDWYHVLTPKEATTIRFTMTAFKEGSPVDGQVILYATDGTTKLHDERQGQIEYDLDPWFEQRQEGAQDWYVQVRNEQEKGSRFHWYTLSIESVVE